MLLCVRFLARRTDRGPTHHPREQFEALPAGGRYTYAVMHTRDALAGALDASPATSRYQAGRYILDIDLDYLITVEECAQEAPRDLGRAELEAGRSAARRIEAWLCGPSFHENGCWGALPQSTGHRVM